MLYAIAFLLFMGTFGFGAMVVESPLLLRWYQRCQAWWRRRQHRTVTDMAEWKVRRAGDWMGSGR